MRAFPSFQGASVKAVESFGHCYKICSQLEDPAALYAAQVQYGMARAHQRIQKYSTDVTRSCRDGDCLQRMLEWKGQLSEGDKSKTTKKKEDGTAATETAKHKDLVKK